jgi:hypothetical protein
MLFSAASVLPFERRLCRRNASFGGRHRQGGAAPLRVKP